MIKYSHKLETEIAIYRIWYLYTDVTFSANLNNLL
jgi:hypothetical protein